MILAMRRFRWEIFIENLAELILFRFVMDFAYRHPPFEIRRRGTPGSFDRDRPFS